jgi:hypothetical protein
VYAYQLFLPYTVVFVGVQVPGYCLYSCGLSRNTIFCWYRGVYWVVYWNLLDVIYVFFLTWVSSVGACTRGCVGLVLFQSQCQRQSPVTTDGQSVSLSWCRAPFGAHDQKLSTVWQLGYFEVGRPLWRRAGYVICRSLCLSPSTVDRQQMKYIQLRLVNRTYVYIQYIQGLCQSRLRTTDHALSWVAQATTAV